MAGKARDFWSIQVPGWLLVGYLVFAQGISAFDYETGVRLGTQEPAERITEVGVAFWYGFAASDLVVYIPLLIAGLIGYGHEKGWGRILLAAALGISVYWPVAVLAAAVTARGAAGWDIDERPYWIVLPAIVLWAFFGLWCTITAAADVSHRRNPRR